MKNLLLMGGGNSHDSLKESSVLYPEQVQVFQNTFKQIVQTQKNLSFVAFKVFELLNIILNILIR